jgi:hypothetical protein
VPWLHIQCIDCISTAVHFCCTAGLCLQPVEEMDGAHFQKLCVLKSALTAYLLL